MISEEMEILENQLSDHRQMLSESRARIEQLTKERDDARDWIKATNQFAWAHEESCPRHDADLPCNCGLDAFLSRPRPYIESWKAQLEEAKADSLTPIGTTWKETAEARFRIMQELRAELAAIRKGYAESIEARTR